MKTEFELDCIQPAIKGHKGQIKIIGTKPNYRPYVSITLRSGNNEISGCIQDKDLEKFAVNILKALKSDRLTNT